jgi:hypothetical protein
MAHLYRMALEVVLNARASDIEAVYFRHGHFNPWLSSATVWARRAMAGGLALAAVLLGLGWWLQGAAAAWGVLSVPVALASLAVFGRAAWRLGRSQRRIRRFAREVEAAGPARLNLDDEGFILVYAGERHQVPWTLVRTASHAPDVVFLEADTSYLFPRSAMPAEAFDELLRLVRRHVPLLKPLPR